jgi:hypothetical protein
MENLFAEGLGNQGRESGSGNITEEGQRRRKRKMVVILREGRVQRWAVVEQSCWAVAKS